MPLQVGCPSCQKKLSVKEELLGKKIKCPACATVIALAAPKQTASPKQPASPKPSATQVPSVPKPSTGGSGGEKIVVACSCGSKLRVPAKAAGKKVKCPKCQTAIPVPLPGKSGKQAPPSSSTPSTPGAQPASNPFDSPDMLTEADAAPLGQMNAPSAANPFDSTDFGQPAFGTAESSPFAAADFGGAPVDTGTTGNQFSAPAGGFQSPAATGANSFQSPAAANAGGFQAAASPSVGQASSDEGEDEEEDAWYKTLGFGVLMIGVSVILFFYFKNLEEGDGGRRRMNAIIAVLYMIGGKWLPCGLVGGLGILCCAMGIKDFVTQKK